MTKVLIFVSVFALLFSGRSSKAEPFVQKESNIQAVEDDLNIIEEARNLPVSTRRFLDFNLLSVITPPAVGPVTPPKVMVRVNIFPVLDYGTKEFMMAMSEDIFAKTGKLDGVTLTSKGVPFHLTALDGAPIGDGTQLSFNVTKQASTFTLDKKTAAFSGLLVNQDPESVTQVAWKSINRPVAINYIGSFVITPQRTPRGVPCVKVINVLELERYISLVTPSELHPEGKPLAVLEAQAVATRTYVLGKIEIRRKQKSDFDVYGSTQDQYLGGVIFKKDRQKNETREPENSMVLKAVENTANKVLFVGGHLAVQAMYSANCAGRSVSYQDYSHGKSQISYLVTVPEYNKERLRRLSTAVFNLTTQGLANQVRAAGINFSDPQVLEIDPINLNSSERATALRIRGTRSIATIDVSDPKFSVLKKSFVGFAASKRDNEFRPYLDPVVAVGNSFTLKTYGDGHNVGFCQEGGVLMAESALAKGKDDANMYKKILAYYYRGITVDDYVQE